MSASIHYPRYVLTFVILIAFTFLYELALHGHLLMPLYQETASLWRPTEEIRSHMTLSVVRQIILSFIILSIYAFSGQEKSLKQGLRLGFWLGLLMGILEAGSYVYIPITQALALAWLFSMLIYGIGTGLIVGLFYKK